MLGGPRSRYQCSEMVSVHKALSIPFLQCQVRLVNNCGSFGENWGEHFQLHCAAVNTHSGTAGSLPTTAWSHLWTVHSGCENWLGAGNQAKNYDFLLESLNLAYVHPFLISLECINIRASLCWLPIYLASRDTMICTPLSDLCGPGSPGYHSNLTAHHSNYAYLASVRDGSPGLCYFGTSPFLQESPVL